MRIETILKIIFGFIIVFSIAGNMLLNEKMNRIQDAMNTATCDAYAFDQQLAPLHCNVIYLESK